MAKTFENIKTTVDIVDKQKLTFVELEVRYPGDNEIVHDLLQKHFAAKTRMNSEELTVWKMDLRTDDKKTLKTILDALQDLDKKYEIRIDVVSDLMGMLK